MRNSRTQTYLGDTPWMTQVVAISLEHVLFWWHVACDGLFDLQDGDFSTSVSCTGDPADLEQSDSSYDCNLYYNLFSYRHMKQIKIGKI